MIDADIWSRIELRQGDITKLDVDAVVNAANSRLAGGGGVDGAIHAAAGAAELHAACAALGGCDTGDAKITMGFNLPAKYIIHTVGPVYSDGGSGEPALLASCYRRSIVLAADHDCTSVAFPAISTGVYGYPITAATEIALNTAAEILKHTPNIQKVIFIFFNPTDHAQAQKTAARLSGDRSM